MWRRERFIPVILEHSRLTRVTHGLKTGYILKIEVEIKCKESACTKNPQARVLENQWTGRRELSLNRRLVTWVPFILLRHRAHLLSFANLCIL